MDCPAFLKPSVLCDFLLCGEGWCWKLSDMKFICQYLLDICLHWCKSMIDICRWSDSPDDGDIGSLRVLHFHRPLALSVNPTLQEHPSFQRVRSTPGQRVKVNSRSMDEGHWRIQGHWKKNNLCSRNEDCYKICLMDMYLQIKFA